MLTRQAAEVSKQRAVGLLAPEVYAMHAKDTLGRPCASMLSHEGIQLTGIVLQGYVRKATREATGRPSALPDAHRRYRL